MDRPSARLSGVVLWVPMLEGDDAAAAAERAGSWAENRAQQWWAGSKEMSGLFAQALGLHGPAWDIYLLYHQNIRWEGQVPPAPTFWMHQLSELTAASDLCLSRDPSRFARELDRQLQGSEAPGANEPAAEDG